MAVRRVPYLLPRFSTLPVPLPAPLASPTRSSRLPRLASPAPLHAAYVLTYIRPRVHLYAYAGRYNAPLVSDIGVARKSRISIREDDDDDDDDDDGE